MSDCMPTSTGSMHRPSISAVQTRVEYENLMTTPMRMMEHTNSRIEYAIERSEEGTAPSYTFYPNAKQIENFTRLIWTIEHETGAGSKCGIIKIVPPEGWKPRKKACTMANIGDTKINKPVSESFHANQKKMTYTKQMSTFKTVATWSELQKYAKAKKLVVARGNTDNRKEVDRQLWESMSQENLPEPVYGADTEGSLYDEGVSALNVSHLGTLLDKSIRIEGVTTTYLYFGMWRTMFPWHAEDVDLYSINYLHHGHPKHWWSVAPEAADLFERMMTQLFPEDAAKCPAFMRHKHFVTHPTLLRQYGIPYALTQQKKNEFVITFPRGYHMGYNSGLNVAESTNFASDRWVDFAMSFTPCDCARDGVRINVDDYVRKYKGEEEFARWKDYWEKGRIDTMKMNAIRRGKRYDLAHLPKEMLATTENNFYNEKQNNKNRSRRFPHCAVCEYFLPEECCVIPADGQVPTRSRRFVRADLFAKRRVAGYDMEVDDESEEGRRRARCDPKEDSILTCHNCQMSVHEHCYPVGKREESEEAENHFICCRCKQNDHRIRSTTCALCELRGGAYVPAMLGSTPTMVHVQCAMAHRRSFFSNGTYSSERVFIHPPPKYRSRHEEIMQRWADEEYLAFPKESRRRKRMEEEDGEQDELMDDDVCFPQSMDTIASRYLCGVCGRSGEGLVACGSCLESGIDMEVAHLTCARAVGMRVERRAFPLLVSLYCHKHISQLPRLPLNSEVLVAGKRRGTVIGYAEWNKEETRWMDEDDEKRSHCSVYFYNGTICTDMDHSEIVSCWCPPGCDGRTHLIDSPVVVRWENDRGAVQQYYGYYRGDTPPDGYRICLHGSDERRSGVEIRDEHDDLDEDVVFAMKEKVELYTTMPLAKKRAKKY